MADKEQLELILEDGVVRWNAWRASNPEARTDFADADLTDRFLRNVMFRGANLRGADLSSADLNHADLRGADLTGAVLEAADLERADLTGAVLEGSNLTVAKFERCDLTDANLREADVHGANFRGAKFSEGTLGLGRLNTKQREGMNFVTVEPASEAGLPEFDEEDSDRAITLTVGNVKRLVDPAHWALQSFSIPNDLTEEHRELFLELVASVAELQEKLAAIDDHNRRLADETEDTRDSIRQALPLWKRAYEELVLRLSGGLGEQAARGTAFAAGFIAGTLYNSLSPGGATLSV